MMGGNRAARAVEEDDPPLAWSLRLAAHEVIMGDMRAARESAK